MSGKRFTIAAAAIILLAGGSVLAVSLTGVNNAAKHLELGNGHLLEGKYEEAIRAFEKAIRIDPENIGARMALAETFIMTGDPGNAEICLKEVLELEPGMAEAGIRLAEVYDEKGETGKAISLLEEILKAEVENIDNNVYIKLADLKIKARDLDGAILLLEEAYQKTNSKRIMEKLDELRPASQKESRAVSEPAPELTESPEPASEPEEILAPAQTDITVPAQAETPGPTPANASIERGNTVGNLANNGLAAMQGDWIYYYDYYDGFKIYKIRTDGSVRTKVNDDDSGDINVVGDWIYYRNYDDSGRTYKICTDGSGRAIVGK